MAGRWNSHIDPLTSRLVFARAGRKFLVAAVGRGDVGSCLFYPKKEIGGERKRVMRV